MKKLILLGFTIGISLGACVIDLPPTVQGRWWCNDAAGAKGFLAGIETPVLDDDDLPPRGCVPLCPDQNDLFNDVISELIDPTPEFEQLHAIAQNNAIANCKAIALDQTIINDNCEQAVLDDGFPHPLPGVAGIVFWKPEACEEDEGGTGDTGDTGSGLDEDPWSDVDELN